MSAVAAPVAFADARVMPLFDRLGWRVASAERITTLRLPGSRRFAYRVTLDDGRTVKLRRLNHRERGARAADILRAVEDPRFAAVLLVEDDLVVEEWIDGVPLGDHPPRREHVERAAAILAALHRAEAPPRRAEPPADVVAATVERLLGLAEDGRLQGDTAADLAAAARRLAPPAARVGITHNDFCGDNIVVDAAGALRVIDNEGVALGFLDYDLARTWHRWNLDAALWNAFVASYQAAGGPRPDDAAAGFWRIAAVAKSAEVRARGTWDDADSALVALRGLTPRG